MVRHFIGRDHGALSLGVGFHQPLPEEEQKNGIEEREVGHAQQDRCFEVTHVRPARKRHLQIAVDYQFKEQLAQPAANHGFIADEGGPQFRMAAAIERRSRQKLRQYTARIERQFAFVASKQSGGLFDGNPWFRLRPTHEPALSRNRWRVFWPGAGARRLRSIRRSHRRPPVRHGGYPTRGSQLHSLTLGRLDDGRAPLPRMPENAPREPPGYLLSMCENRFPTAPPGPPPTQDRCPAHPHRALV